MFDNIFHVQKKIVKTIKNFDDEKPEYNKK